MGAKTIQIKQIIQQTESEIETINDSDDRINADLLKAKKAMAYENIRSIVQE